MEENLKLCLVRPAPATVDRVGCFELVTPTRWAIHSSFVLYLPFRTHLLQADSEFLCNDWMRALQRTIQALHECDDAKPSSSASRKDSTATESSSIQNKPSGQNDSMMSSYEQIRRVPGNDQCADCGRMDPKWVSINLGVGYCISLYNLPYSPGCSLY